MAPVRGVAEPLKTELACADLLRLVENSTWILWKNGYTGPSRADRSPGPPYFTLNNRGEVSTTSPCLHLL